MDYAGHRGALAPLNEQEFFPEDAPTGFYNPSTEAILVDDVVRAIAHPGMPGVVRATVCVEEILYLVHWSNGTKRWYTRNQLKRVWP